MVKAELLNTLENLTENEFKKFKWFLNQDNILEGFKGIPVDQLENAAKTRTVDLMVQKHQDPGALQVTIKVLEKISRNDLVQRLQNSHSGPKGGESSTGATVVQKSTTSEQPADLKDLKRIQRFAKDVTLDHNTAHPNLILSNDGKQVHHGDVRQKLPSNPERFYKCVNVLGHQSISTGRFYYEVQVKGKTAWYLGVAKESIKRKGSITTNPQNGYWTIMLRNDGEYEANEDDSEGLSVNQPPQKVGVFVDYEEGLVCFYDVEAAALLYRFTGCSFTEKLYPFFSPCTNNGGTNSAPLIISPVNHTD